MTMDPVVQKAINSSDERVVQAAIDKYLYLEYIPEGASLQDLLTRKYPEGLPEEKVFTAMKNVLNSLVLIKKLARDPETKPEVSAARVGTFFLDKGVEPDNNNRHFSMILVAFQEDHMHLEDRPDVGERGAGMLALELAFGSLPESVTSNRENMVRMVNNFLSILNLKLQIDEVQETSVQISKKLPLDMLYLMLDEEYVAAWREEQLEKKDTSRSVSCMRNRSSDCFGCLPFMKARNLRAKKTFTTDFLQLVKICLDGNASAEQILSLSSWDRHDESTAQFLRCLFPDRSPTPPELLPEPAWVTIMRNPFGVPIFDFLNL